MSEHLPNKLVRVAAEAIRDENPFNLRYEDFTPTKAETDLAEVATVAVLRVLADAYFDGLLSGIRPSTIALLPSTVPDAIRALADAIEKGGEPDDD